MKYLIAKMYLKTNAIEYGKVFDSETEATEQAIMLNETAEENGIDMQRDFNLVDLAFSVAMLAMGAMLLSFAVDCESASVGVKAFSILSGGILMVISALSLD